MAEADPGMGAFRDRLYPSYRYHYLIVSLGHCVNNCRQKHHLLNVVEVMKLDIYKLDFKYTIYIFLVSILTIYNINLTLKLCWNKLICLLLLHTHTRRESTVHLVYTVLPVVVS